MRKGLGNQAVSKTMAVKLPISQIIDFLLRCIQTIPSSSLIRFQNHLNCVLFLAEISMVSKLKAIDFENSLKVKKKKYNKIQQKIFSRQIRHRYI